ncbi:conserved hypothetical protein [Vibrio harveyi]|uniref:hypothetical protein n=1 Tax=Vibrio TaxID=662 RepID=UPI0028941B6C|nr:conserved hypothetical protein [Vibrio harveyi]CAH1550698.1 conserved hypothetical protein [Vibrio harveyi]CAH1583307.1 conserved hypothetical protein [Vibrio harveyi]
MKNMNKETKRTQTNQKESTMKYEMYETQLDLHQKTANGRRALRKQFGKQPIVFSEYAEFLATEMISNSTDFENTTEALNILSLEESWVGSGSPVIFVENRELAQTLFDAKVDVSGAVAIEPPYKQFSLSFPSGTEVNGFEINSCLVSVMTVKEILAAQCYIDDVGAFYIGDRELDDVLLVVNFQQATGVGARAIRCLSDLDDSSLITGECADWLDTMLKIALTLCIYNSATEGEKLVEGYPKSAVKLPKGKTKVSYQGATLKATTAKKSASGAASPRKIKHRIPYFRNLKAPRFYRGKHKDALPGSRWVWVREVDINNSMNTLLN